MSEKFRPHARIVTIGRVTGDQPQGWTFDARSTDVPAVDIQDDGSIIWGGYTVAELREIADGRSRGGMTG